MAAVVGDLQPDHGVLATPIRSWDVQSLMDHVFDDLMQFIAIARGREPDWSLPVPRIEAEQWTDVFRRGAYSMQVHWKADVALDSTTELMTGWRNAGYLRASTSELPRSGQVPRTYLVDQQVAEFTMHSWDLAQVTGTQESLDPELAQDCSIWLSGVLAPQFRGPESDSCAFGPEQPVSWATLGTSGSPRSAGARQSGEPPTRDPGWSTCAKPPVDSSLSARRQGTCRRHRGILVQRSWVRPCGVLPLGERTQEDPKSGSLPAPFLSGRSGVRRVERAQLPSRSFRSSACPSSSARICSIRRLVVGSASPTQRMISW